MSASFRFALLGDDPAALSWLRSLANFAPRRGELIFAAGVNDQQAEELVRLFPSVRLARDWSELFSSETSPTGGCDAVLVASVQPSLLEGARRLVAEGKALVLFPRPEQESAFAYEISLIRDDSRSFLLPVFPDRERTAIRELKLRLDAGELGRVLQLQLERELPVKVAAGRLPLLDLKSLHTELLADADLLRHLGGNYDQVTALYSTITPGEVSGDDHESAVLDEPPAREHGRGHSSRSRGDSDQILLATVTLSGTGLPRAIWTLKPIPRIGDDKQWDASTSPRHGGRTSEFRWTITGDKGTAEIRTGGAGEATSLSIDGRAIPLPEGTPDELLARTFDSLQRGLQGELVSPDWIDLTRALETVEAAGRSVRRRRTIDLYFETTSERSQFKTHMAALGCAVLMWSLLGVVGLLLVGAVPGVPTWLMHLLRGVVFLPLFLFLALQLLLVVARPARRDPDPADSSRPPSGNEGSRAEPPEDRKDG